jgi:signal transduction histidine kinase
MPLTRYLSGKSDVQDRILYNKILGEIQRIGWEIQRINDQALTLGESLSDAFGSGSKMDVSGSSMGDDWAFTPEKPVRIPGLHTKSNIDVRAVKKLIRSDWDFIGVTRYMDIVIPPLMKNNPNLLFIYIINNRGITRGYPWKDFSVLPADFNATKNLFFYIADPDHNPERRERWTEAYVCPLTKAWMVTCSCPVYSGNKFIGIVGIDANLQSIIDPLGHLLNETFGGYGCLVSPKGNLIVSSDEGMHNLRDDQVLLINGWDETKSRYQQFLGNIEVGEVTLTSGRADVLRTRIKANDWDLFCIIPRPRRRSVNMSVPIAETDTMSVYSPPHSTADKSHQPMMSFLSSFNESLKNIEKLIEGTAIIGKGVLDHRINVERKDEIGLLALSINKMAGELQKRRDDLMSAYKKMSQMDRLSALGRLTAGIAHEINNPLSIISNYIQVLVRDVKVHPDTQKDLKVIQEEIDRASGIIRGLLNFSAKSITEKSTVWVNDILQKTLGLVKFELKRLNIELVEQYDQDLPLIFGNPTHLQQAFLNILLNSAESMTQGGKLTVVTRQKRSIAGFSAASSIEISIADTGRGIDKKYLDEIFDPFFTVKGYRKGTGLGLSITYGIVKEHGGSIDLSSKLGKGTAVKITLPSFKKNELTGGYDDKNTAGR